MRDAVNAALEVDADGEAEVKTAVTGAVSPSVLAASLPGVRVASRLRANFCAVTGLERVTCLCPSCKGAR